MFSRILLSYLCMLTTLSTNQNSAQECSFETCDYLGGDGILSNIRVGCLIEGSSGNFPQNCTSNVTNLVVRASDLSAILDNSWSLRGLKSPELAYVTFVNFNGFELTSNSLTSLLEENNQPITQRFLSIEFVFFLRGERVSSSSEIDTKFEAASFLPTIFSAPENTILNLHFLNEVRMAKPVPSVVFRNARILLLVFRNLQSTLISQNSLAFDQIPSNARNVSSLNASVSYMSMYVFNVRLDSSLLNLDVFAELKFIFAQNFVAGVEQDLFLNLKSVRVVILQLANLRHFLDQGLDWINSINADVNVSYSSMGENVSLPAALVERQVFVHLGLMNPYIMDPHYVYPDVNPNYAYPDVDFCLFRQFPHSQVNF